MATRRKKVVKIDTSKPALIVENGEVKAVPQPVLEEIEVDDVQLADSGKPKWTIHTANGDAVYEFVGNCQDCTWEKRDTPVFKCISYPIKAHAELGNQLAAFSNDGGSHATPLCQAHYHKRLGQITQQSEPTYKVIESNKFV